MSTLRKPFGYVYLVINKTNGRVYVGQTTKNINTRWTAHIANSRRRTTKPLVRFHAAIRKYGARAFDVSCLHIAYSRLQLDSLESTEIQSRESFKFSKGYNSRPSAYGMSDGQRAKMRGAGNPMAGTKVSDEHRAKMLKGAAEWRDANKEAVLNRVRKASEVRWQKRPQDREVLRRRWTGSGSPTFGKKLSTETKEKMQAGAAHRRQQIGREGRVAEAKHAASIRWGGNKRVCTVCGKPQHGLGLCNRHYLRFKHHGDPYLVKGVKVSV